MKGENAKIMVEWLSLTLHNLPKQWKTFVMYYYLKFHVYHLSI